MTTTPSTIVLKFGGSVLHADADIAAVVHEIYRWVRSGHKVVAVVSAIEGQTDALLDRAAQYGPGASEHATALLLATGELQSAALLGLALGRAGIDASVLPPSAINLCTLGETLDAEPVSLDITRLRDALDRVPVAVVPGFVGIGNGGQWTLLGRGGTDLTALFLAQQLGATCRLIKDVDGLYQWDPAKPGPRPQRYARIGIGDALALGGQIVQNKALRFVHQHAQQFEVSTFNASHATLVTADAHSQLAEPTQPAPIRRVAVLGFGTVGQGVVSHLKHQPDRFAISAIAVRDTEKARRAGAEESLLTTDLAAAIDNADVVIETLGGLEPACTIVAKALSRGTHVITANKALIARHASKLRALAKRSGATLTYSAAVGGAAPVLEVAGMLKPSANLRRVEGIINGTTNFILDRVLAGGNFNDALTAAQHAGFAEADPSRDLDGSDSADKLALIAHASFGLNLDPDDIDRLPLTAPAIALALEKASPGQRPRYIAWLEFDGKKIKAGVGLALVSLDHPLANVRAEHNRVVFSLSDNSEHVATGRGAGRWPTAQAVLADLLDLHRGTRPLESLHNHQLDSAVVRLPGRQAVEA
ncbi:MAG: homoserine dehydrogenase [bacterium]